MILSDSAIRRAIKRGAITITPYDDRNLGSNSYDMHLANTLAVYTAPVLDARADNAISYHEIPGDGFVMQPGELYLGATIERTATLDLVPLIEGKSSVGRLGLSVHATAGVGDAGFDGYWTLELSVIKPLRVYAGMPVAQLLFFDVEGPVEVPYGAKPHANYAGQGALPVPSRLWRWWDRPPVR